jgi:hypothetical protein
VRILARWVATCLLLGAACSTSDGRPYLVPDQQILRTAKYCIASEEVSDWRLDPPWRDTQLALWVRDAWAEASGGVRSFAVIDWPDDGAFRTTDPSEESVTIDGHLTVVAAGFGSLLASFGTQEEWGYSVTLSDLGRRTTLAVKGADRDGAVHLATTVLRSGPLVDRQQATLVDGSAWHVAYRGLPPIVAPSYSASYSVSSVWRDDETGLSIDASVGTAADLDALAFFVFTSTSDASLGASGMTYTSRLGEPVEGAAWLVRPGYIAHVWAVTTPVDKGRRLTTADIRNLAEHLEVTSRDHWQAGARPYLECGKLGSDR